MAVEAHKWRPGGSKWSTGGSTDRKSQIPISFMRSRIRIRIQVMRNRNLACRSKLAVHSYGREGTTHNDMERMSLDWRRRTFEAGPLEARPLEARPLEARPLEARPLEARPLEARPLEARLF
jgi:hypothetical protein